MFFVFLLLDTVEVSSSGWTLATGPCDDMGPPQVGRGKRWDSGQRERDRLEGPGGCWWLSPWPPGTIFTGGEFWQQRAQEVRRCRTQPWLGTDRAGRPVGAEAWGAALGEAGAGGGQWATSGSAARAWSPGRGPGEVRAQGTGTCGVRAELLCLTSESLVSAEADCPLVGPCQE